MAFPKKTAIIIFISSLTIGTVLATTSVDGPVNNDFNGKSLTAMGAAMNNPLLRLLGKTFEKLEQDVTKDIDNKTDNVLREIKLENSSLENRLVAERKELIDVLCQLHKCGVWTQWSECSAKINGTYGSQSRTRTCGNNGITLCPTSKTSITEHDARICEGSKCPSNYTVTNNGFCIGVHVDNKLNWTTAREACKQEGGLLVNVDSHLKAADVNTTLQQMSRRDDFWIDGTRTLPSGSWRYDTVPKDPSYTTWRSGEPGSTDDCQSYVDYSFTWKWFGRSCTQAYYFICEII